MFDANKMKFYESSFQELETENKKLYENYKINRNRLDFIQNSHETFMKQIFEKLEQQKRKTD